MEKPKVVTLFSGYDSQCMSLDRLHRNFPQFDYELIAWSEIDKYAIQAHDAVYPQWKDRNLGDVCKIDWSKVEDFDLLTYSSPCQDFSAAGLQKGGIKGSGTRSSLLWECERAIEEKRPKYLLMENVAALVSQKFIKLFNKWQNTLESYGYTNYAKVLNAKDYGVPQNRERIFMVSVRNDIKQKFYFPQTFKLEKRLKDVLEDKVDEKYYISKNIMNRFKFEEQKSDIHILGTTKDENTKIGQRDIVYANDGCIGCLTATDYKRPKQIMMFNDKMLNKLVNEHSDKIEGIEPKFLDTYNQAVKDESVTILTNVNTCNLYYVTEPTIAAMRGRNPENPSDRSRGTHCEQRLEAGENVSNTLTSVQKDNLIIEPTDKTICLNSKVNGKQPSLEHRIYDTNGISTACTTGFMPSIIEPLNEYEDGVSMTIKSQYAKNGMANFKRSDGLGATGVMQIGNIVDDTNIGFKNPQIGRIYSPNRIAPAMNCCEGVGLEPKIIQRQRWFNKGGEYDLCPTIGCNSFQENNMLNSGFRIRKLTPTECFRLMDVSDFDIDKLLKSGISNSQLYKLAGNSIVVACLYHIFRKLFIETGNDSKQLELF